MDTTQDRPHSRIRLPRRTGLRAGAAAGAAALFGSSPRGQAPAQAATDGRPVAPRAGAWKTGLLDSGAQLRPAPPPDPAATQAELRELRALSARRDAAALDRITFWDAGAAPYRWTEAAIEWTHVRNALGPGLRDRAIALVTVAMHDAMVAVWDAKYAYNRPRPTELDSSLAAAVPVPQSPSYPSEHAAAAGAAAAVLGYLFPRDAETFAAMAEEAARSRVLAGAQYPSDSAAGLELGRKVAALAIQRGRDDHSDATWDGVVPTGPGLWTGTNPANVAARHWKPWVLASPDQLRPPPPPAHDSEQLAAELAELKRFERTPRSTGLALMWQYGTYGGPRGAADLLRHASQRIFEERLEANAPWAARLYALIGVSLYDGWIATQDAKFTYWSLRPNQLDPSLTTVFPTPNFPSYPSNRAAIGMAAELVGHFFPRDVELFRRWGEEYSESAIWSGIHFRSDLAAANAIGRGVNQLLLDRISGDA
jgi:hypothetical protein